MVQINQNIIGVDSAIFMHPKTWEASGHVDAFNDPLVDNKDSKKRYRADVLIEEYMENIKIAEGTTESAFKRNSFIYDFMSSMRQKINDPLGVRAKKRKEISQR